MGSTILPPGVVCDYETQRTEALKKANRIRTGRAALISQLKHLDAAESAEMAAEIIEDPPELLCSMQVGKLLLEVRKLGPKHVDRILAVTGVSGLKPLCGLSLGQRGRLCAVLRMHWRQV